MTVVNMWGYEAVAYKFNAAGIGGSSSVAPPASPPHHRPRPVGTPLRSVIQRDSNSPFSKPKHAWAIISSTSLSGTARRRWGRAEQVGAMDQRNEMIRIVDV